MVEHTDIFLGSPIEEAKEAVQQVFQQEGFEVKWLSEYDGKAIRGSRGMNIALGGFAQRHEVNFKLMTAPDKTVSIRLIKPTGGWTGGLLGRRKVKKQYEKIVKMLSDHFDSTGTLKGRSPE